jgi:NAD-dependent dihydropyrimidine dehydrogenase PreA subunit
MQLRDLIAEILETAFRLVPFPTRTDLRTVGSPGRMSPVFLTGNYDLTVRRVLRALRGLDVYLLVAPSHGVNVWCASSGGHLTTHQVVTAVKVARLEDKVTHRELILPQLAATGVDGKEVRRRTGWIVRFGPAHAADIPVYLESGKVKTEEMRRARFGVRERLEMAAAWATPIALIASLFAWSHLAAEWLLIWALALAVFLLYDRLPFRGLARQALLAVTAIAAVSLALAAAGSLTPAALAGWAAGTVAVCGVLTFDYAGSTPIEAAGLFKEKDFQVVLDLGRCTGAYNCFAVCPEACFQKRPEIHKVELVRGDRCIRCGACIVQCPQDALAFETPDGLRVEPDTIRRFKLNLLGERAHQVRGPS